MVCVDTSFLVALIRRDPEAENLLENYVTTETKLTTTPITVCELFKGAYKSNKDENIRRVRKILTYLQISDFSVHACETYGRLVNELGLKGSPIGDLDAMIAAIALASGESLLTSDKEHFGRISGLTVRTW